MVDIIIYQYPYDTMTMLQTILYAIYQKCGATIAHLLLSV